MTIKTTWNGASVKEIYAGPATGIYPLRYALSNKKMNAIDEFCSKTLKQKAFPPLIGKINSFSIWLRRIKVELYYFSPIKTRVTVKQRNKIIGEKILEWHSLI